MRICAGSRSRRPPRRGQVLSCLVLFVLPGCFTFQHTVGQGPRLGEEEAEGRWWALWGLLPLGEHADVQDVAGTSTDYRVTTEFTLPDVLWSAIPSILGFYRQSVTIER